MPRSPRCRTREPVVAYVPSHLENFLSGTEQRFTYLEVCGLRSRNNLTHHFHPTMPHSGGTGDRPYSGYSQDAAPQRPVLQRVGRYYNLHGQHAQDHSVINNHGYPGSRDERPRRSGV